MKLAFVSDLHLSPETHISNKMFLDLLNQWRDELDALYILGDFFDYWLGDDDSNEFISTIKESFANFTKFKPIYFIGGNHDFAIGKRFCR